MFGKAAPLVGVWYTKSSASPAQIVKQFYETNHIKAIQIDEKDPTEVLKALQGSGIEVALNIHKDLLENLQTEQGALAWVKNNIQKFPSVNFKYVVVGNGVGLDDSKTCGYVFPAIKNISSQITVIAPEKQPKVTLAINFNFLDNTFTPSSSVFTNAAFAYLQDILQFLVDKGLPLFVSMFPCDMRFNFPGTYRLDYANFTASDPIVVDMGYSYKNLFDAMLDAVYQALKNSMNISSLEVIVSKTGWPTSGDDEANKTNAQLYNSRLIDHLTNGTPRRPNKHIKVYLYTVLDESTSYYGIFLENGTKKYPINFK